ncbi:MAG: phosphoglycerate dehydrogenase [Planctomycetota bacterium]
MADKPIRVLVSDKLAQEGVDILTETSGVEVTVKTGMTPDELKGVIGEFDAIIIRSATKLTADILECATNLKAIARAGVGVDNVDIPAATRQGAIVMNTPGGNTVSTAELAVTLLLALSRHIHPACQSLKEGAWDRKKYQGTEVNGKTLGLLGLGRIGCEVARRCRAFNMRVLAYDPFISEDRAKALGIELVPDVMALVKEIDYLSVHTPLTDETRAIIGTDAFAAMKDGVRVVNGARGGIIDEEALLAALESGKCAGAALDVYTEEPPTDRRVVEHPHVLCTPHLGASTEEAQISVAIDAAKQIVDALKNGEIRFALNFPALSAEDASELAPYGRLAYKLARFAGGMVDGQIRSMELAYEGEVAERDLRGVTLQAVLGLMSCVDEGVNPVSAAAVARDRGIDIRESKNERRGDFHSLLTVRIDTSEGIREVAGTIFGREIPRIVMVDGYHVEADPEGTLLIMNNEDKPGVIGAVGSALGDAAINIGAMNWGRKGDLALCVINVDADEVPAEVHKSLKALAGVKRVRQVRI